jgi:hypothetical protein
MGKLKRHIVATCRQLHRRIRLGDVIGRGRSTNTVYVIIFELEDGRLS